MHESKHEDPPSPLFFNLYFKNVFFTSRVNLCIFRYEKPRRYYIGACLKIKRENKPGGQTQAEAYDLKSPRSWPTWLCVTPGWHSSAIKVI